MPASAAMGLTNDRDRGNKMMAPAEWGNDKGGHRQLRHTGGGKRAQAGGVKCGGAQRTHRNMREASGTPRVLTHNVDDIDIERQTAERDNTLCSHSTVEAEAPGDTNSTNRGSRATALASAGDLLPSISF